MNTATPFDSDPLTNQLLSTLSGTDWRRWFPLLEAVQLKQGDVLCESGRTLSHVTFPTTAVVSLLYLTRDGASSEIAVVGNDGVVGISVLMGSSTMPCEAKVQSAGWGYRLPVHVFKDEINRAGPILNMLLRYAQGFMAQVAQTALCNRFHSIDQQLCRRLLVGLDRGDDNELAITHEAMSNLLGVRREGVTAAALKLQNAGVISYRRGHISVLNRAHLENRCCECYAHSKREFSRLLPMPMAA